jgi:leader peptidase (prepilin peptidase)/N-methyltransferase
VIGLGDLPPSWLYAYGIALGLLGGSFINVVVYRVPRGESLVRPGSHCPACGAPVRFYDNVPVLSFLLLRGRARCCGARISPRYPLVELIGGAIGWALVATVVLNLPADTSVGRAAAVLAVDLVFALGLVAVAFIDLEHMYVPDAISLGGTALGLATFWLRPELRLRDALLGAVIGFAGVWLPFGVVYRWIRGRTGMGLGDAKLLMMAGAWFGWPGAVFALLAGAVQGTVVAVAVLAVRGRIDEPEAVKAEKKSIESELEKLAPQERAVAEAELAQDPLYETSSGGAAMARIAFGPFLALAMLEYLLFGRDVLGDYLRWLGLFS